MKVEHAIHSSAPARDPGLLERVARRAVRARLARLGSGEIKLVDGADRRRFGRRDKDFPTPVTVNVHDSQFYADIAFGGTLGAGEGYIHGHWSCDDIVTVVRMMARNERVLEGRKGGLAHLRAPIEALACLARRNTRRGSRRNIAAHYDLGNDFFALFLDPTMMYSAAIFERPDSSLHEASLAKIERICRKLELAPDDHLLEIGTGWGSFAIHAAGEYGCRVTTTTISREQFELATRRVREAGLAERVTVLAQDYRELEGRYDKLVSIEMVEAVGHQYLDTFFRRCSRLLRPQGTMLLQSITIADQRYAQARRSVDYIKKYVFPGGFLPSVAVLTDSIARVTDMRLFHCEDIGPHYATTLRHWRERFLSNIDRVRALGYEEPFLRLWEYYLCYCEGGFLERVIGNVQLLAVKPRNTRAPLC